MKIDVEYRLQYGKKCFYPISEDAKLLCRLMNRNSLSVRCLKLLKDHGWDAVITSKKFSVDDFEDQEETINEV